MLLNGESLENFQKLEVGVIHRKLKPEAIRTQRYSEALRSLPPVISTIYTSVRMPPGCCSACSGKMGSISKRLPPKQFYAGKS